METGRVKGEVSCRVSWGLGVTLVLAGCGTVGDLIPGGMGLTPEVQQACAGVMDDAEILTEMAAARVDQAHGYTQADELALARENCSTQAGWTGRPVEACVRCKSAILDAVYGP